MSKGEVIHVNQMLMKCTAEMLHASPSMEVPWRTPLEGLGWGEKVACVAMKTLAQAPFWLFNAHDRLYILDTTLMKCEDI